MTTLTAIEPTTSIEAPQILHGDCLEVIQSGRVKAESVNLIFTSPPYADQRKNNYGGIHPNEYVAVVLTEGGGTEEVPQAGRFLRFEHQGKGGWRPKTHLCLGTYTGSEETGLAMG